MKAESRSPVLFPFVLIPIFLWIGFVCAISFMEAWIKFQAPNVSLSVGLSIGKLVFAALNRVEWCFAAIVTGFILIDRNSKINIKNMLFYLVVLILAAQTMYLLPILNERADTISKGLDVPPSSIHFFYILTEAVKVVCLSVFGVKTIVDRLLESKR